MAVETSSPWRVSSVVVQDDVTSNPTRPLVYFTAGRSTYLDGRIYAYALDPWTGELIHENCVSGPRPDPFETLGGAGYMDGAKSDILVSDGADLFLHQERFRSDLKRVPAEMQQFERERGGFRIYPPVAGPPDVIPDKDPLAAFEGRMGALLWSFSGDSGEKLAEVAELSAPPVYDGLIAAHQSVPQSEGWPCHLFWCRGFCQGL